MSTTIMPMDGTIEGCAASLKDACGEKNKNGDPSEMLATTA
jgi:hypothetical protein